MPVLTFKQKPNFEDVSFNNFLKDHETSRELPLWTYYEIARRIDTEPLDLSAVSDATYEEIQATVNGLLLKARDDGVIGGTSYLKDRRCQP